MVDTKWTDEKIETLLAQEISRAVPDVYEKVSTLPAPPAMLSDDVIPFPHRRFRPVHRIWLVCACLVIAVFAGIFVYFSEKAVITIEVNPSISLSVNRFERVLKAEALNGDGASVLYGLKLNHLELDTALNALVGAMTRQGYITDGTQIMISVNGKDANYNARLYTDISETLGRAIPGQNNIVQNSGTPPSGQASAVAPNAGSANPGNYITEAQAKSAALSHAGLNESNVVFTKLKLDWDDGRALYEVGFYAGSSEYDYDIDATSGTVVSFDNDIETFNFSVNPSEYISIDEAKSIVLNHAGVDNSAVAWKKAELDIDDGVPKYEMEFYYNNLEYEYDVNAVDGTIIKFDRE